MDMADLNLAPSIGFTFDTSLAIARCIYDGFLDRYPRLKLIAAHGGGALQMCIQVCGPDNVMYGSDYPHNIGDMVGVLGRVNNLSGEVRHLVRGGNAQRIFDLG